MTEENKKPTEEQLSNIEVEPEGAPDDFNPEESE